LLFQLVQRGKRFRTIIYLGGRAMKLQQIQELNAQILQAVFHKP
jgi:hypothetical protein